jgi:D-inositol-3-phosphate glycosyltransferase
VARDEGVDPTGKLILTSPHFSVDNCLPVEQLNQVYNAADIGINTCIGEGWGLVNSEHGATGVMQVVPDHTSLAEIFDAVPRIGCNGSETDRNYGLERMLPNPEWAADLLSYYYENQDLLKKDGQWCYSRLHEESFTWPYIQQQLKDAVKGTLNAKPMEIEFKGFGTPAKIV